MTKKLAGILLPITSLPSEYGVGCFSQSAYDFVDQLKAAGQSLWQILPIHPTSYGDSPYQSFSTFAGNPYFISLEALIDEGVLTAEECDSMDFGVDETDIDYKAQYHSRYILLRKAYERSSISENNAYQQFVKENEWWLSDYALFMALKEENGGRPWYEWEDPLRLRDPEALAAAGERLKEGMGFCSFLQFKVCCSRLVYRNILYHQKLGFRLGELPSTSNVPALLYVHTTALESLK